MEKGFQVHFFASGLLTSRRKKDIHIEWTLNPYQLINVNEVHSSVHIKT